MIKDSMNWLYPAIEPFNTGMLAVDKVHQIYYEESGNPKGEVAIYLHGGPGSGSDEKARRFFDPRVYRIVVFDQRGCGKSIPHASIEQNTTWDLVADIEKLREHLKIERWLVFGGSWGSTLALSYAQKHPERVRSMVLRGIFFGTRREVDWLCQNGASEIFPDGYSRFASLIPESERQDMLAAYHQRLTSADPEVALLAADRWSKWEGSLLKLLPEASTVDRFDDAKVALAIARIESHYFVNKCFLEEDQLLHDVFKIRHIPAVIIHGRYDIICPFVNAWQLHKAWPEADFCIVPDAGHSASELGISRALVAATDRFSNLTK